MNCGFMIYERLILEEIAGGRKNIEDIAQDLGMERKILAHAIEKFKRQGIIYEEKGLLEIDLSNFKALVQNSKGNTRYEIVELLEGLANENLKSPYRGIDLKDDKSLKMKKVFLDSAQAKILHNLFQSIEKFLGDIETQNISSKRQSPVKEKQLICWGHCNYLNAAKQVLTSV